MKTNINIRKQDLDQWQKGVDKHGGPSTYLRALMDLELAGNSPAPAEAKEIKPDPPQKQPAWEKVAAAFKTQIEEQEAELEKLRKQVTEAKPAAVSPEIEQIVVHWNNFVRITKSAESNPEEIMEWLMENAWKRRLAKWREERVQDEE